MRTLLGTPWLKPPEKSVLDEPLVGEVEDPVVHQLCVRYLEEVEGRGVEFHVVDGDLLHLPLQTPDPDVVLHLEGLGQEDKESSDNVVNGLGGPKAEEGADKSRGERGEPHHHYRKVFGPPPSQAQHKFR